jgi:hypothetical protein
VEVHDFMGKELDKAIPYGVYDVTENKGWVSAGTTMARLNSLGRLYGGGGKRWGLKINQPGSLTSLL